MKNVSQLLGGMWFILLALVSAMGMGTHVSSISDLSISFLSRFCLAIFYCIIGYLILTRPHAKAQETRILPKVAAFVGTYMPWCVGFLPRTNHVGLEFLSTICIAIGSIMMLITIRHLGRSFSLVPQAHSVVRTGPYRWIKHPLYLSEELAVIGVVIQYLSPLSLIVLALHIAVQICRIRYEENLLRHSLPEYSIYEIARWRLIPCVW